MFAYKSKAFEVGAFGVVTANGNKVGLGNTLETYISYSVGNFTFTVDDYFFFNEFDSLNNYFDWRSRTTQHFIEGRVKYSLNKWSFTGAYVLHKAKADDTDGIYLETEYVFSDNLSITAGGVTGASGLNFQTAAGVTHVGINGKRYINITKTFGIWAKASLIGSPNYKEILRLPGVGRNPIYFVLSLTF